MGYMSVIAKAGQYNAAHADVKSLMANHYYGSLERHDALLDRWHLSLELFGRLFVDDVGLEPGSIMPKLSGFLVKETKFQWVMERPLNPTHRDRVDMDITVTTVTTMAVTTLLQEPHQVAAPFETSF